MIPDWASDYIQMVEDCEKRESRLTEWERGFIDGARIRLEQGRPLTPKQTEALDTIWERVTAKG